jgi:hypothetical protein
VQKEGDVQGGLCAFWTYLQVEAVQGWVEFLPAGEAVPGTTAKHTGEQAEQQEVTEQDFHGAGAERKKLKHIERRVAVSAAVWGWAGQGWGPSLKGGRKVIP